MIRINRIITRESLQTSIRDSFIDTTLSILTNIKRVLILIYQYESSSMDSQTPVARDNVTPREREISDPSSMFSRVTEDKEEEERTAPPSSPCHGIHERELARQILKKRS